MLNASMEVRFEVSARKNCVFDCLKVIENALIYDNMWDVKPYNLNVDKAIDVCQRIIENLEAIKALTSQ